MTNQNDFLTIPIGKVIASFRISRQQIYDLEHKGVLPKRPRGYLSTNWFNAFLAWYEKTRGSIPDNAKALVREIEQ